MKYYFVSDVHGCYDALIQALNEHGFDKDKDTIVSVGDLFDRGTQSREVLSFFMSCPHRILIWGNHDTRLYELIYGLDVPHVEDVYNGVLMTLQSFNDLDLLYDGTALDISRYINFWWMNYDAQLHLLEQYFGECVFAAEWSDLIAVHSWLPLDKIAKTGQINIHPYWRQFTASEWRTQIFRNGCKCFKQGIFPEKQLLVGHMFTWLYREAAGLKAYTTDEKNNILTIDADTFITDKLIAIDGCVTMPEWGGKVNVVVKETDETPILYKGEPEYEHFID